MAGICFKQLGGTGVPRPVAAHVPMRSTEVALGLYLNSPDHLNNSLLVTDYGIYLLESVGSRFISYELINGIHCSARFTGAVGAGDFIAILMNCRYRQYPQLLEFLRMIAWR